jgi:hypothetical protein
MPDDTVAKVQEALAAMAYELLLLQERLARFNRLLPVPPNSGRERIEARGEDYAADAEEFAQADRHHQKDVATLPHGATGPHDRKLARAGWLHARHLARRDGVRGHAGHHGSSARWPAQARADPGSHGNLAGGVRPPVPQAAEQAPERASVYNRSLWPRYIPPSRWIA